MSEIQVSSPVPFHSGTNLLQLAGEWFRLDVANGDAQPDTLDTCVKHISLWGLTAQILGGLITYLLHAMNCHDQHKEKVSLNRVRELRINIRNELAQTIANHNELEISEASSSKRCQCRKGTKSTSRKLIIIKSATYKMSGSLESSQ
jgi:hypothetical protein